MRSKKLTVIFFVVAALGIYRAHAQQGQPAQGQPGQGQPGQGQPGQGQPPQPPASTAKPFYVAKAPSDLKCYDCEDSFDCNKGKNMKTIDCPNLDPDNQNNTAVCYKYYIPHWAEHRRIKRGCGMLANENKHDFCAWIRFSIDSKAECGSCVSSLCNGGSMLESRFLTTSIIIAILFVITKFIRF